MGRRQKKGGSTLNAELHQCSTLREENTGKKNVYVSSILRMQHLQKLATWAGGEASMPPLGALFGHHLAVNAEAAGIPLDPSTILCQRCESILQPGFNCTVRIEKNANKTKWHKNSSTPPRNNVVFKCHFCSHQNMKGGTTKGHVKGLLASRPKLGLESKHHCFSHEVTNNSKIPFKSEPISELKCMAPETDAAVPENHLQKSPLTPSKKLEDLSGNKRKLNASAPNKLTASGNSPTANSVSGTSGSSKHKRKGWSSLKEIAESIEAKKSRSISNFAIPFILKTA